MVLKAKKCRRCGGKLTKNRYFHCYNCISEKRLSEYEESDLIYFGLSSKDDEFYKNKKEKPCQKLK